MKVVLILPKWTLACESCCAKLHFECRLSCGGTFKSMQGLCNFSVGWHAWTLTLWLLAWFTVLPKSTNMLRRLTWYSTWHPAQWGGGRIRVQHTTALHGTVLAACYWKEEHWLMVLYFSHHSSWNVQWCLQMVEGPPLTVGVSQKADTQFSLGLHCEIWI